LANKKIPILALQHDGAWAKEEKESGFSVDIFSAKKKNLSIHMKAKSIVQNLKLNS